ncbi:MAG: N-acetyl sugar amidotransferase [Bacteroidetes bacterium HGW-Bacteroidetes-21]|jgi:N-acetyl sugar amidotransferase|nr:MAG: N-acetyl sugar amidotransferase [Bacteroidetes bacterium HGW-Bacteroidetes-21]
MSHNRDYQICSRCILDTSDYPDISFDINGVCDICIVHDSLLNKNVFKGAEGWEKLQEQLAIIKNKAQNRKYDCLLGISGGVDSSYLLYLLKEWNLRPLVVHVDSGWNSDISVKNIETLLKSLQLDLFTYVINWEEIKDIQLSFFKASVLDIDLPFDNIYVAVLYKIAAKHKIKHIITGHNFTTEGYLPPNFNHYKLDTLNLKDIHKKYGNIRHRSYPIIGPIKHWYYRNILKIKIVFPLNYIDYNKSEVKDFLERNFKWKDYGGKHYENIFTRFYQGYILPTKFNVDKRKGHMTSLICSGQITRDEAINEIKSSPYKDPVLLQRDKEFFIKKLDLTEDSFEQIMNNPIRLHTHYKSYINLFQKLRPLKTFFKKFIRQH